MRMRWPSLGTYFRTEPTDEWTLALNRSYVGIRLLVGVLGVTLPITLVLVDWFFLNDPELIRGSMSAYYHSAARDLFVGGLVSTGVVLVGYMFWNWKTWDFVLSSIGGTAVLFVAFFPTARPSDGDVGCERLVSSGVPPCTALQDRLGEATVRNVHGAAAGIVVVAFLALCVVFALREFGFGRAARTLLGYDPSSDAPELGPMHALRALHARPAGGDSAFRYVRVNSPRTVLFALCALGVLLGGVWAVFGTTTPWLGSRDLPPVYAGEFMAFGSFGLAWIVASWDLLRQVGPVRATVERLSTEDGAGNA